MDAEVIDLDSGTLVLVREGRKLVKVSYSPVIRVPSYRIELTFDPNMPTRCQVCGDDLDLDFTMTAWEDQAGVTLCDRSPNGNHMPENIDLPF